MIENYITVLSIIIIIRGLFIHPYLFIMRKTNLKTKGRHFFFNKVLANYTEKTWLFFWLSALWLIVKYFDFIKGFYNA